ncbi:diguanylate cyclase [Desulfoluna sp.]|uniref:sensor domain-containing diguanylate cyclase n=1 Tax=Desulfoluna sp. TaxID=2045199 RepID=UPI002605F27D|nr:diguanylate cyclase [Desulfoluna sp.]
MLEKWWVADGVSENDSGAAESHQMIGAGKAEGAGVSAEVLLRTRAGVAYIGIEPNGVISQWDGSAESFFGYDAEHMIGRDLYLLVPSVEEEETLRKFFISCLRGGAGAEVSTTCVNQHGDILVCRWYAVPAVQASADRGLTVLVKNVTEQMHAVTDLNRVRHEARNLFSSAPIGIFQADIRRRIVVVNPELAWMLGYESPALLISTVEDVSSIFDDPKQAKAFLFQLYEGEQLSRFRCRLRRRDGGIVWALCYGQITRNATDRTNGFFGFCIDISQTIRAETELKRVNDELRLVSIRDGLTRIANRRHFDDCMDMEWKRHVREKAPLSFIICDIDHFKNYNDTYGHQAGDQCLVKVAEALASCVHRPGDLVARYGGEEFAVILSCTHLSGARHLAEKMRRRVEALVISTGKDEETACVTISLGLVSMHPDRKSSAEELIRRADGALYEAKGSGRNRCVACGMGPDEASPAVQDAPSFA